MTPRVGVREAVIIEAHATDRQPIVYLNSCPEMRVSGREFNYVKTQWRTLGGLRPFTETFTRILCGP